MELKVNTNFYDVDECFSPNTPNKSFRFYLHEDVIEIPSISSAAQLIGFLFKKCRENDLSLEYDISYYDLRVAEDDYSIDNDIPQLDLSNQIMSFGVDKFVLCPIGTSVVFFYFI